MNRSFVRSASAAIAAVALSAASAAAQQPADTAGPVRRPTVHILPSIGSTGISVLGWHDGDFGDPAILAESRVYGVAAEVRTPLRGVDLRAGVSYSRPDLYPRAGSPPATAPARADVTSLTVDAVVRGPRILDVRPYVLGGVGARHYAFGESEGGSPLASDQIVPTARVGAGLAWNVGRYDLYVETIRTFGSLDNRGGFHSNDMDDSSISFGLRIPIK